MSDQQSDFGPWLCEGSLIYRLVPDGWFRGKPMMANAITLRTERGRGTTETDAAALAARVHRLLVEDDARIALTHVDDGRTVGTTPSPPVGEEI